MKSDGHRRRFTCQKRLIGKCAHKDPQYLTIVRTFFNHLVALVHTFLLTGRFVHSGKCQIEVNSNLVDLSFKCRHILDTLPCFPVLPLQSINHIHLQILLDRFRYLILGQYTIAKLDYMLWGSLRPVKVVKVGCELSLIESAGHLV